jgi:hypothetical protein
LAVITSLFLAKKPYFKTLVFVLSFLVLYSHGSKGQLLSEIFIPLLYQVYVGKKNFNVAMSLPLLSVIIIFVIGLFFATMKISDSFSSFVDILTGYSNYTENAVIIIDSHLPLQLGRLTLQNNILSIVPRILYHAKPKDFGSIYLAKKFFPSWYYQNSGAPSFGIGLQYADFGVLALPYLILFSSIHGFITRIFVTTLGERRHPAYFVVLVFLCGVSLIPTGVGWYFPEIIILSIGLGMIMSMKKNNSSHLLMPEEHYK